MSNEPGGPLVSRDFQRFRDSLTFTEAESGFSARLIEKDYYCSLVLQTCPGVRAGAGVQRGTCLSKVHAEFFRLSEDLDFSIATPAGCHEIRQRRAAAPIKDHFSGVPTVSLGSKWPSRSLVHNNSRQYNGRFAYRSAVTGEREFINVEVSLREEIILPSELLPARTLLRDPHSAQARTSSRECLRPATSEAYAEKIRAALTRPEPAIRDFFDIDHALQVRPARSPQSGIARSCGEKTVGSSERSS